jgi:restriction system protein
MSVPDYQSLMLPLLQCAENGQEVRTSDCVENLGKKLGISESDMNQLLPSGKQTVFSNRIHWARTYMAKANLVEPTKRGHFRITQRGQEVLRSNPAQINNDDLSKFPEFQKWREQSISGNEKKEGANDAEPVNQDLTPEESIERSSLLLIRQLQKDVLESILSASPSFFEKVIVDLLIAMGYGGGRAEMGEALGKSHDGGVDGVIKEDELGLDVVYIQAKRYDPSNTIGRPAIQAFVGGLEGFNASKGVFVTTSSFASPARDYASRIQKRIILIDGDELSRLMIRHGVGVRTKETYEVKRLDEDYFAEG